MKTLPTLSKHAKPIVNRRKHKVQLLLRQVSLLLICTLGFIIIQGQTKNESRVVITGRVIDATNNLPISYATVIIKSEDGQYISGSITNEQGGFEIKDIPPGNYLLEVQFIGYNSSTQPLSLDTSTPKKLNVGTLQIQEAVSQLEEVMVTAERSTVEQKLDRKVINIGKDLSTTRMAIYLYEAIPMCRYL